MGREPNIALRTDIVDELREDHDTRAVADDVRDLVESFADRLPVVYVVGDMTGETYVSPFNMATIHAGLGEEDEAFAWLEEAFDAASKPYVTVSSVIASERSFSRPF